MIPWKDRRDKEAFAQQLRDWYEAVELELDAWDYWYPFGDWGPDDDWDWERQKGVLNGIGTNAPAGPKDRDR